MSELEQQISDLTSDKRRLVELLLREEKEKSAPRSYPLSFAQQRLWFLDQLQPGKPAYNMPFAWRLTGPLEVNALSRSLNEIVRRHHVLRATFATEDGQPLQVITPAHATPLPVESLEALPEAEREARALTLAREEARQPFDLARGPLLRTRLLRLSATQHVLLITMHHIVCDGWSTGVLLRELAVLYTAFADGQTESPLAPSTSSGGALSAVEGLPELPWQYADYAAWQREHLRGEVLEAQLAYWKNQLANAPLLELPTDRPRPPTQSLKGETRWWTFPSSLSEALKALSRQEGVTLFILLLAAFQALLQRYSGQTDIVVGTPIANRQRTEVEGLIGFFVNTLALRLDLSGDPTFRELVARAREACLGAYAHQDLPFEKLVEALQVRRDPSRSPLFQVMLALQNAPLPVVERAGLTLSPIEVDNGMARFDLALSLTEREAGLAGVLKYNTDLFDATTIDRLLGHFQALLEGVVAHPEQRLSALPLLTDAEQQQLLIEWNATQTESPREWCVHQLFETQVEQIPDRIAVSAMGLSPLHLTYAELDRRANQLAHHLQTLGVGPEVRVGVCVERSPEMVIGLLGILKAGGGYVPLDPAYPEERLAFMVADAQAPVVITQSHLLKEAGAWGLGAGVSTLCLDTDWEKITASGQSPAPNPQAQMTSDNLAYVIYTSGSTGRPKGVLVAHHGLGNLAHAQIKAFGVKPESRILQFASFSFDASVSEIIMALLGGATLCLASLDNLRPSPDLLRLLRDEAIEVVTLPPSVLAVLPDELLPALKTIVTAGEACSAELVARWTRQQCLINAYGPTETTVCATMGECCANDQPPPIGRAMDNTQVYLLDSYLNPVPVGVPGELHIGGVGLARGYLGRPDVTAEKFVPNPFAGKQAKAQGPSAKDQDSLSLDLEPWALGLESLRLYKTGDLARYLPDGNIEYLGRLDHQVKVRGYRIESGEIESVLQRYPGVQAAVVLARSVTGPAQAGGREKQLVAYLVSASGEPLPSVSDLRRFLQAQLPDYMLPPTYVFLESLPLTPNGKVDRKALPAPEASRPMLEAEFVAPRTPIEETLAGIWAQVLGVEQIGVHDNFFELGGHSLLATQIVAKIRAAFQVELPLALLFNALTVADLAREVAQAQIQATDAQNLDEVLNQLEGLSDDEVAALLGE